ncbi:MAG: hypothetical protein WA659_00635 [Candidatus Aquirickettsiella sp.]
MLNSETANNTQTFFSPVSTAKLLRDFILSPDGKDKKGLDHICYGDLNGGGHMMLNERNLERKRQELAKKHCKKARSDCEKSKEKLQANYERQLKKLDQERKSEDSTESASNVLDKKKIEANFKSAFQKAEEKCEKKIKDAVENEISQLEKRINKIIKEQKTMHNFFPLEWGPLEIGEIISDIIKDKNSTITAVPTPTLASTGEKEVVSSGARDKRALGQSWEVKGEYSEIAITVIIAEDSESKKMKLISGYPANKIEKQQHLSPTFSR